MKRYKFEAAIQRSTGWGAFVLFPHDVKTEFGTKGRVPVQALLGRIPYAGSLMPFASGHHKLAVPRTICQQLGKAPNDLMRVELWQDDAPQKVELPEAFQVLLQKQKLLDAFESLTLTRRKEYCNWIISAKREDTRQRRMEKAIKMLEAEVRK